METKPLSVRMIEAADTLEEASQRYDAAFPSDYDWSAEGLRSEAPHVEKEEAEETEVQARIELLAVELFNANNKYWGDKPGDRFELNKDLYLAIAETLVKENGWRNED